MVLYPRVQATLPYSYPGFCFSVFLFQQCIAETAEAAWTARAGLGETLLNMRRPATNIPSERVTLKVRTSSGTMRFGSTTHTQMPFQLENSTIRTAQNQSPRVRQEITRKVGKL